MDLTEMLATKINEMQNLTYPCVVNYLSENEGLAIYPVVGSATEFADWAGNLTKNIKYEVQMRGTDPQLCTNTMWRIASMLDSLEKLDSKNGSYIFQDLNIDNEPSLTDADTSGHFQYTLGFSVQIYQTKGMLNNG